jgi:chromosome segregation ATPase
MQGVLLREELQKREANSTALLLDKKQLKFELEERKAHYEVLCKEKESLYDELKRKEEEFQKIQEQEEHLRDKQFDELKKLNDARFALYQASLDKERLKNQVRSSEIKEIAPAPKHWLKQLEQLLKGENIKNVDFSLLPRDLSNELLTLHETKALYKQLRGQFDEKNEILEEARAELYRAETEIEELTKAKEELDQKGSEPERYLERELLEKQEELTCMQLEVEVLSYLMKEALSRDSSEVKVG